MFPKNQFPRKSYTVLSDFYREKKLFIRLFIVGQTLGSERTNRFIILYCFAIFQDLLHY